MKRIRNLQARSLFAMCLLLGSAAVVAAPSREKRWDFDKDAEGKPPAGFIFARTGQGSEGQWVVKKDESAPSKPNVLAQTSQDKTDYRFPLAVAEGTKYKDAGVTVKFKTISGEVDQGAGLVFRFQDKDNYYVVRANALEDNFRIYHVVKGRRVQFAGANFKVTPHEWHTIRVEARGNEFRCYYDGQLRITAKDDTFRDAGRIGLWTKADSVIYFDDLTVEELGGAMGDGAKGKIFAQKLVEELVAQYGDLVRVGLHLTPPHRTDNIIVACNVTEKIGKKSDPEDLQVIQTGKPVVLREDGHFDVTLPLHDASGKVIGAIGLTFKPRGSEQESSAVQRARRMAREVESKIPSAVRLFKRSG